MQHAPRLDQPSPHSQSQLTRSLRSEMEGRRGQGRAFSIKEAVDIIVPLCVEVAQRHGRGERLFVHPSSIMLTATGQIQIANELAAIAPALERDRACLAPEEKHGEPGDSRASVFTIGAIFYELLTNELVGPAMPRPSQVVPGLHPAVEVILGKALVTDRAHRPDDLGALAQALHHVVPSETAPPPADESHLDRGADFAVDVSLSMLPPEPTAMGGAPKVVLAPNIQGPDPYAMAVIQAPKAAPRGQDPTAQLADLKARLESDPRPRYVVIKEGMDHGPFNAVELLQQIGSHAFEGKHILRETLAGDEKPIEDWKEFAPFAEHAKINREIVAEKKAIEQVVVAEAQGTRTKTFVGIGALAIILAGIAGWYFRARGLRNDAIRLASEQGISVEAAGGLKGQNRKVAGARPGGGGGPVIPSGLSCEGARAKYIEEISIGGAKGQADLTAGQFASVLNNGSYIVGCGTPSSMHVTVCAAVQNGRAVGVTVTTDPPSGGISSCIASAVRRMSFPSNPKLDIATTRF
jgi:eukaryotic-like serine/threonine-protein kinase